MPWGDIGKVEGEKGAEGLGRQGTERLLGAPGLVGQHLCSAHTRMHAEAWKDLAMYLGLSAYTDAVFWGCIQASKMGRSLLGTIAVQVGPLHPEVLCSSPAFDWPGHVAGRAGECVSMDSCAASMRGNSTPTPPTPPPKKPARSLSLSCAGSWAAFGVSCDKRQQRGL